MLIRSGILKDRFDQYLHHHKNNTLGMGHKDGEETKAIARAMQHLSTPVLPRLARLAAFGPEMAETMVTLAKDPHKPTIPNDQQFQVARKFLDTIKKNAPLVQQEEYLRKAYSVLPFDPHRLSGGGFVKSRTLQDVTAAQVQAMNEIEVRQNTRKDMQTHTESLNTTHLVDNASKNSVVTHDAINQVEDHKDKSFPLINNNEDFKIAPIQDYDSVNSDSGNDYAADEGVQGDEDLIALKVPSFGPDGLYSHVIPELKQQGAVAAVTVGNKLMQEAYQKTLDVVTGGLKGAGVDMKGNTVEVIEREAEKAVQTAHDSILNQMNPVIDTILTHVPNLGFKDEIHNLFASGIEGATEQAKQFISKTVKSDKTRQTINQYTQFMKDQASAQVTSAFSAILSYFNKEGTELEKSTEAPKIEIPPVVSNSIHKPPQPPGKQLDATNNRSLLAEDAVRSSHKRAMFDMSQVGDLAGIAGQLGQMFGNKGGSIVNNAATGGTGGSGITSKILNTGLSTLLGAQTGLPAYVTGPAVAGLIYLLSQILGYLFWGSSSAERANTPGETAAPLNQMTPFILPKTEEEKRQVADITKTVDVLIDPNTNKTAKEKALHDSAVENQASLWSTIRNKLANRVKVEGEDPEDIWTAQIVSRYLGYAFDTAQSFSMWDSDEEEDKKWNAKVSTVVVDRNKQENNTIINKAWQWIVGGEDAGVQPPAKFVINIEIESIVKTLQVLAKLDLNTGEYNDQFDFLRTELIQLGNEFQIVTKNSTELLKFDNGQDIIIACKSIQQVLANVLTAANRARSNPVTLWNSIWGSDNKNNSLDVYIDEINQENDNLRLQLGIAWKQDKRYIQMMFNNKTKLRPQTVKLTMAEKTRFTNRLEMGYIDSALASGAI